MAKSSLVECPVCETEFDPKAAGGWCTNSECGEWRYEGTTLDDDAETGDDDAEMSDDDTSANEPVEDEVEPTPAIRKVAAAESAETDEETDEDVDESEPVVDDEADQAIGTVDEQGDNDGGTDTGEPVEEAGEASGKGADEADGAKEPDDESDGAADETAEIDCPGCGETLAADTNFCPSCGEDVSTVEPEPADESSDELTECPSCSAEVDPEDSFCASCGEELDAHRGPDELSACPSCDADVDPEDSFCVSCGENLDAHREGTEGTDETDSTEPATDAAPVSDTQTAENGSAPESLVLAVRGQEITVSDGDTVGKELRRIVTESGGDEDAAVRIHREHIQFFREDGQFYLVDLGRNPTRVNDTRMEQDDREPIGPGDKVSLSGVVTLAVQAP